MLRSRLLLTTAAAALAGTLSASLPAAADPFFLPGNLVISVYGDGDGSGTYTDNQASPITLEQVTTTGAVVNQLVLPQVASGSNHAISGEYGSSSEGTLELSANGQYLTIAGYGVTASTYNANPASYGGGTKSCVGVGTCNPLAQTASVAGTASSSGVPGQTATVVPRVIALVDIYGNSDTSTALTGVFNENNPRSVATVDGSSFYISGQGFDKNDTTTQGLFLAQRGASTATSIDSSFDTRTVEIQNNKLYLSADSTEGSGVHENISSYGTTGNLPTGAATATILPNFKSKYTVTSLTQLNALDQATLNSNPAFTTASKTKGIVYLSPENYFFASPTVLYVADSGNPKGDNNGAGSTPQGVSDGGLQKWVFDGTNWNLEYTLTDGLLDFVPDTTACGANQIGCGTTGLIGLAGEVVGDNVELFATNATLGDEDQTYLYGITDLLSSTTGAGESFTVLDTAAADTNIRGVAFAPVPEPGSLALLGLGLPALAWLRRRRAQG